MILYWSLYVAPLLAGLSPLRLDRGGRQLATLLAALALLVVIGGREGLGCDWNAYVVKFLALRTESLGYALTTTDPAYALVNWVCARIGLDVAAVNTVCAAIFIAGLFAFCRRQPAPVLAALIAVPYLVVVVAMGYTRQATAIGLLMLAYNAFAAERRWTFLLFVVLAATFHRSAVLFAPLALFVGSSGRGLRGGGAIAAACAAAVSSVFLAVFVGGHVDRYAATYVQSEYESAGDLPRLALNAAAALVFLLYRRRWRAWYGDGRLYFVLSVAALVSIPMMTVSSVGADRLSLYLIPLQMAAFSRLPQLVPRNLRLPAWGGVAAAYGVMLYVWLNYADHAYCWVPYRSVLL